MNHLNLDMLQQKAADIARANKMLAEYATIHRDKFLQDETLLSAAKYQLIVAIEAAQNICNHIAARVAKKAPVSYSDCYMILSEESIIDKELAMRLAQMAKFSNLLVHRYGNIDDRRVYDVITGGNLGDLQIFLTEISKMVGESL
jgi:uncharacterized protein YutE (UPF0331/DUF86 family)